MGRYHINPKTGDPSICKAKISCPFSSEFEHFENEIAARKFFEREMEKPTVNDFSGAVSLLNDLIPLGPKPKYKNYKNWDYPQGEFFKLADKVEKKLGKPLGAGREKTVFKIPGTKMVAKIPHPIHYENGIISMFQEANSSMFGFNKLKMAESRIVWTKNGLPIEIQEEVSEITQSAPKDLSWISDFGSDYHASLGKNSKGEYVKYDLDMGEIACYASCGDDWDDDIIDKETEYLWSLNPIPFGYED